MSNILITSAGRRVTLVKAFQESSKKLGVKSMVFTADLNPKMSPACYFSDKFFKVGFFNDPDYMDNLLNICLENNVKIIIPTIDTELTLLSKYKSTFKIKGIDIIISNLDLIEILRNKINTNIFFNSINIRTPKIFNEKNIQFPVFLKPFDGSNSRGTYIAENINEIKISDLKSDKMIISRFIDSNYYDEYTVDMYFDKNHKLKCVVPRIRIKVVGGESNQGVTKNQVLDFVRQKFNYLQGAIGCLTLQLFSSKSEPRDILAIEINPRFEVDILFPEMQVQISQNLF